MYFFLTMLVMALIAAILYFFIWKILMSMEKKMKPSEKKDVKDEEI